MNKCLRDNTNKNFLHIIHSDVVKFCHPVNAKKAKCIQYFTKFSLPYMKICQRAIPLTILFMLLESLCREKNKYL